MQLLSMMVLLQLRQIHRKLAEIEQGQDDQELAYEETVGDLKSLIIYAKATSIKPWDWKKQKATTVNQMFSFGEPTANQLCSKWTRGDNIIHSYIYHQLPLHLGVFDNATYM